MAHCIRPPLVRRSMVPSWVTIKDLKVLQLLLGGRRVSGVAHQPVGAGRADQWTLICRQFAFGLGEGSVEDLAEGVREGRLMPAIGGRVGSAA